MSEVDIGEEDCNQVPILFLFVINEESGLDHIQVGPEVKRV
jgi:hypothetical protein